MQQCPWCKGKQSSRVYGTVHPTPIRVLVLVSIIEIGVCKTAFGKCTHWAGRDPELKTKQFTLLFVRKN
jgi:hypothetical protein